MRITDNMVARVRANYQYAPTSFGALGGRTVHSVGNTNVYFGGNYAYSGAEYVQRPRTRVEIDLNVRVRGNGTFVGFEDVSGPISVGESVEVYESESGVVGDGKVTEIDGDRELVYLSVDWPSLTEDRRPSHEEMSASASTTTQLLFVGASSTTTTFPQESWIEMIPRPCLADISGYDTAIWITAPLYEYPNLTANGLVEPYIEMRQNVIFGNAVVAA